MKMDCFIIYLIRFQYKKPNSESLKTFAVCLLFRLPEKNEQQVVAHFSLPKRVFDNNGLHPIGSCGNNAHWHAD